MNKKLIRLTESDLHKIVKESVKRVLREMNDPNFKEIMSHVTDIAVLLNNGAKCIAFDSDLKYTYTVVYTAKPYSNTMAYNPENYVKKGIEVTRIEKSDAFRKPIKDKWIITDKNYEDQWLRTYDDGNGLNLRQQIEYDKKAYELYNEQGGSL